MATGLLVKFCSKIQVSRFFFQACLGFFSCFQALLLIDFQVFLLKIQMIQIFSPTAGKNVILKSYSNVDTNIEAAVQLITGHAALKYPFKFNKMKLLDANICPYCEFSEETIGHFLGQCPAFARQRGGNFNAYCTSLHDIFENCSILNIVRYTSKTKSFLRHEESNQSGVI